MTNLLELNEIAILIVLGERNLHGLQIRQMVKEESGIRLGATTLYRKIHKLEETGFIEETKPPRYETDTRRRYYKLTAIGQKAVKNQLHRLKNLIHTAEQKPVFGNLLAFGRVV